ncbi:hypothetical protein G6F70_001672 [Rhizopus microsporus]|uniref:Uncharacterized protein n=2 Tax=Rhizopus TaxID=4842 RepID=A0A367JB46_RHIAZ|nr:hypothetical protein G6F71_000146 [Rhizopus microsporus]RCH87136.1 hypothetical protein CU097_007077 [Rhizopus azygosporus]KAG1203122.1 hypothetical protein G6F70_001672 [Rhizopus microsporus]KAG1215010.1 hypothetical protein G6F69_001411 [Rhizopus microsporus]KAG1238435.1 hypothetical protein G6F67_000419 [Rhizopus microsporus]
MNYCNRTGRSGLDSSSTNSSSLIIDSDCSDDLIINEEDEEIRARHSEDEDYYKPIAPPPSPQQELITLQDDVQDEKRDIKLHAQTLDQLLRKTLDRQQSKICKRQKRRSSLFNNNQHKLKELLSSIVDEDMIHELRDMVL